MNIPYRFEQENALPSPALIYYQDIIRENTMTAIRTAGSPARLWPHVKSHKSADVVRLQTRLGIDRYKCATIAEAEALAGTDARHILLAYPLVGPNIQRLVSLALRCPDKQFYALEDDLVQLALLGRRSAAEGLTMPVFLDVNTGMNRTGLPFESVLPFALQAAPLPGIRLCGLHIYDGDRHEKEYAQREEKVRHTVSAALSLKRSFIEAGLSEPALLMGGSPTFPCYAKLMPDAFYSPGTVFIYDQGYTEQFPDLPYRPGATVLTRVVSHPAEGFFTLDAGYKAISAEQGIRGKLLDVPHAIEAFQSEEHWTFRMEPGHESERPPIGSVRYVVPWHICPTTALYDRIYVVSDGRLTGSWQVSARHRA